MKKITIATIFTCLVSMNINATTIDDIPTKYFAYYYDIDRGCQSLGNNPFAAKKTLANTLGSQEINIVEYDEGLMIFKFKHNGQDGKLILSANIPTCAGIASYYRSRMR